MGWTLADVRALDPDEFDDLVLWAKERNKGHDADTVDADDIVAALDEKKRAQDADDDDDGRP